MNLKTLVAVNNINNLSDARYCAGMGVDILGFCLTEDKPGYMSPTAIKEIAGWVSGVKIAGEFLDEPIDIINDLVDVCGLHLVQLNELYLLDDISRIKVPVIQRVVINKDTDETELVDSLRLYQNKVRYFLITTDDFTGIDETNSRFLADLAKQFLILLGFGITKEGVLNILEEVNPAGIALKGGHEIKPGLKTFDELSEILEELED
jgi:phosphoribosylanthranilate isomerase